MAEHTPGPWEMDIDSRKGGCDQIIAADSSTICFMATYRPPQEAEANATLIKAAPDLLAALEAALPFIPAWIIGGKQEIVRMQIKAALTKAIGKEPQEAEKPALEEK